MEVKKSLNKYIYVEDIAEGNSASVKKYIDMNTFKCVAIKMFNDKHHLLYHKEIQILEHLNKDSPKGITLNEDNNLYIPQILHKNEEEKVIVMTYYSKMELFDYINNNSFLPHEVVKNIFKDICKTIKYAHDRNVIHRDLKPENILIDQNLKISIIDWGLSSILDKNHSIVNTAVCGSLHYIAPELLIKYKCFIGFPNDIWSLGIILYILFEKAFPWDADTEEDYAKKILQMDINYSHRMTHDAIDLMKHIFINYRLRYNIDKVLEHPFLKMLKN